MEGKIVEVYDRRLKRPFRERIPGEGALRFLYEAKGSFWRNFVGRLPLVSKAFGAWYKSPTTKKDVGPFIRKYNINMNDFEEARYHCFNDFFIRKLAPGARHISDGVISPADARCFVFPKINEIDGIYVKGQFFSLRELVDDETLYELFKEGSMAFFRLAPVDYHRFHMLIDGTISNIRYVEGPLFSVNPIALRKHFSYLTANKRIICELETAIGKVLFIMVGATNVGSIKLSQEMGATVKKGDELGYFEFGGSALITIFEPKRVKFALDLLEKSNERMETLVQVGQPLATT